MIVYVLVKGVFMIYSKLLVREVMFKGVCVLSVVLGWIEIEVVVLFVEWMGVEVGMDYEGGKKIIMDWLGGILVG